ncbi:MAG: hypothetical protein JWR19_1597 [Pedosphaera sp.]|nr:hypothetical protein [Pedosphaera sp.]
MICWMLPPRVWRQRTVKQHALLHRRQWLCRFWFKVMHGNDSPSLSSAASPRYGSCLLDQGLTRLPVSAWIFLRAISLWNRLMECRHFPQSGCPLKVPSGSALSRSGHPLSSAQVGHISGFPIMTLTFSPVSATRTLLSRHVLGVISLAQIKACYHYQPQRRLTDFHKSRSAVCRFSS